MKYIIKNTPVGWIEQRMYTVCEIDYRWYTEKKDGMRINEIGKSSIDKRAHNEKQKPYRL